ncbi:GntR family transcriptional regulator [Acuticoccus sp. I52.16.1]|uniref:GntR family transcriptional regulator n=1 Tax=Acuticoccus sp. I52.16.1 TaxID=2928472 RepID=UPI001FD1480F|nr:GntR family transcriptional regulator [Acuticoccus sp. I52.16.1]UOM35063.1 GntR family transcriptional regulator [Acuticoccus sp. I52.16.1]
MRRSDQVAQDMIEAFRRGAYAIGDALPPEAELCRRFKVSRATVRTALSQLQGLGLVHRHQGAATRVMATEIAPIYVHSMHAAGDLMNFAGPTVRKVHHIEPMIADEEFAAELDNRPGRRWVRVGQTRHVLGQDVPVAWTDVYIAHEYGDIADEVPAYGNLVYTLLEKRHGVITKEIRQSIVATNLSQAMATVLCAEPGESALKLTRRYIDMQDTCSLVAISTLPSPSFCYEITLRRQA